MAAGNIQAVLQRPLDPAESPQGIQVAIACTHFIPVEREGVLDKFRALFWAANLDFSHVIPPCHVAHTWPGKGCLANITTQFDQDNSIWTLSLGCLLKDTKLVMR